VAQQQQPKVIEKPVDWDELYPGRFIKAGDLKGKQVTLTISAVRVEELVGDKGPQMKGIMSFDRTDKQLPLNKTNGICMKAMFGREVQKWVGKRVTLFPGNWDGEPAIRVYGSPDIEADMKVTVALPRKKPVEMVMRKVGAKVPAEQGSAEDGGKSTTESKAGAA
jgi:hypothetical protein